MKKELNEYKADYTYKKDEITVDSSSNKFPVVEQTNNASLFPLGPKDDIDLEQLKENSKYDIPKI